MSRLRLTAAAVAIVFVFLAAAVWAQGLTLAVQTVDAMNTLWGRHPFARANHAKGVVAEGSFTGTPAAAELSKAAIFSGQPVSVTVRFSDSTGMTEVADGSPQANPHGMAIKFYDPTGDLDIVANSLPFFPVATGEDFLGLLQALAASGPGVAKPTPADQFIAAHPSVGKAFGSVATPVSFASETYNGIDAFVFVNAKGERRAFRFQLVPVRGAQHLSPEEAARMPPDFLVDELPARLAKEAVAFRLFAQLADPGDQTKDPTKPWPDDRRRVHVGTLVLSSAAADNVKAQRDLRFLPNRLSSGIEVSDDPLIDARVRAYVISFGRRVR